MRNAHTILLKRLKRVITWETGADGRLMLKLIVEEIVCS